MCFDIFNLLFWMQGIGGALLPKYKELPTVDSTNGAVLSEASQQAEDASTLVAIPEQVETKGSELAAEKPDDDYVEKQAVNSSSASLPQCPTPLSPFTQVKLVLCCTNLYLWISMSHHDNPTSPYSFFLNYLPHTNLKP